MGHACGKLWEKINGEIAWHLYTLEEVKYSIFKIIFPKSVFRFEFVRQTIVMLGHMSDLLDNA
jgi:hypothetical protein